MPRNMSFMLTTQQVRERTKDVTRRIGWWNVKPGQIVNACEKCMGLKKGEKVKVICQIQIVSKRRERLFEITKDDCVREGFPEMHPNEFVTMFMKHNKCGAREFVNRIEFRYI